MLKKELKGAVNDVKNPAIRIIIIASFVITSVLWGIICALVYNWGNSLMKETTELKVEVRRERAVSDSLRTETSNYFQREMEQARKVNEYVTYQDSVNTELKIIKRTLISR